MHTSLPRPRGSLVPTLFAAALSTWPILSPGSASAAEVKVDGADVTYPATVDVDGATLRLTGTGLRKKLFFNVYTVASYAPQDAKIGSREALAALDAPKRLHLVMERGVDGETMAEAFREAIEKNHDLKPLKTQVKQLEGYLRGKKAEEDDHLKFDHVKGKGVRIERTGREPLLIEGTDFARAVWDIYLGRENVSGDIAKGLVSRL